MPSPATARTSPVFSFGTLLDPAVQRHLFGRTLGSSPAELAGHGLVDVVVTDPAVVAASGTDVHPGLVRKVRSTVPGGVLELDDAQLAAADDYEVADYARRRVLTTAGAQAWAYVAANPLAVAERIAVVGDSIAYGRSDVGGGWQAALSRWHLGRDEVEHRFWNLALPGTTLARIDGHIHSELRERLVDTVLLSAGINDLMLDRTTPEQTVDRVRRLCEAFEAVGIRPVVLGPTWIETEAAARDHGTELPAETLAAYRERLLAWGRETFRDVLDPWPVLEHRPDLLTDHLHPGPAGHELLAAWIFDAAGR